MSVSANKGQNKKNDGKGGTPTIGSSRTGVGSTTRPIRVPGRRVGRGMPRRGPRIRSETSGGRATSAANASISSTTTRSRKASARNSKDNDNKRAKSKRNTNAKSNDKANANRNSNGKDKPKTNIPIAPPAIVGGILPICPPSTGVGRAANVACMAVLIGTSKAISSTCITRKSKDDILSTTTVSTTCR